MLLRGIRTRLTSLRRRVAVSWPAAGWATSHLSRCEMHDCLTGDRHAPWRIV